MTQTERMIRISNIIMRACYAYKRDNTTNRLWRGSDIYANDIMALDPEPKPSQSINSARPRTAHVVGCKCERCDLGNALHVHGCECVNCRMARYIMSGLSSWAN